MHRFLFFLLLLLSAGLGSPTARAQSSAEGLPARPSPFRFVTDEANLLSEANAKTLENGLRRYADDNGTQIVLVTVPSLGGRSVADYARALGAAWGVGQRDKNNGIVVLLSGQERQVSIQAGSGLRDKITPDVVSRVINEKMTPSFKQGNYFAGLRSGLNTLMATANPNSKPAANASAPAAAANTNSAATTPDLNNDLASTATTQESSPYAPAATPEPTSSGPGIGTLLLGALVIGGGIWLVIRLFRRRTEANAQSSNTPNFYPNNPGGAGGNYNRGPVGPQGNGPAPNFYPNQYPNQPGAGGMGNMGGGGSGIGGILATGAAAAAGAYLGNRMAGGGHNDQGSNLSEAGLGGAHNSNLDPPTNYSGTPSSEFPALGGAAGAGNDYGSAEPDYFSGDADNSGDYFSDDSTYNDTSSDNVGGGGFDDDSDNSGSW